MKPDDTESQRIAQDSLESAIKAVERSLRADGAHEGRIPEGELAGYEWRALFRWAEQYGRIIPPEMKPELVGGREHDVTHLPAQKHWRKFTKPDGCGFTVEICTGEPIFIPATPLQYLKRLWLQNEFWGDAIRLDGVQSKTPGARIVTLQPDISGEAPSSSELDLQLRELYGFRRLDIAPMGYYKSHSYLLDGNGLFDVHPANFVQISSGSIVPIDVIMISFSEADLEILRGEVI